MSIEAVATFLTVRDSDFDTVLHRYQNRWVEQDVDGFAHYPFSTGQSTSNRSGGQSGIDLDLALSQPMIDVIEAAITGGHYLQVAIKKYQPTPGDIPPTAYTTLVDFFGEVIQASLNSVSINVTVGSNLDPVQAQVPPRKFTTKLVGSPPQL